MCIFLLSPYTSKALYSAPKVQPGEEIVELMNKSLEYQKKLKTEKEKFAAAHQEEKPEIDREAELNIATLRAKLNLLLLWTNNMEIAKYKAGENSKGIVTLIYTAPIGLARNSEYFLVKDHRDHVDEYAHRALYKVHNLMSNPSSLFWNSDEEDQWKKGVKIARAAVQQIGADMNEIYNKLPKLQMKLTQEENKYIVCEQLDLAGLFIYRVLGKWPRPLPEDAPVLDKKSRVLIYVQYMAISAKMIEMILDRAEKAELKPSVIVQLNNDMNKLNKSHDAFFRVLKKSAQANKEVDFDHCYKHVRTMLEETKHNLFFKAEAKLRYH
jgi:hypothetical protein